MQDSIALCRCMVATSGVQVNLEISDCGVQGAYWCGVQVIVQPQCLSQQWCASERDALQRYVQAKKWYKGAVVQDD